MVVIDASLSIEQRTSFVNEIRSLLPSYLASASHEIVDPVGDAATLLQLRKRDLQKVIERHLALSEEVGEFISGLKGYLRAPSTASVRPRVETRVIQGQVDWGATIRRRAARGADVMFVARPASRVFDTYENRAVVWVVAELLRVSAFQVSSGAADEGGHSLWSDRLEARRSQLQLAQRAHWLRSVVRGSRFDVQMRRALADSRRLFLRRSTHNVARLVSDTIHSPVPDRIVELLCRRFFEPSQDWRLYELVVVLRVASAFREVAARARRPRLLVGSEGGPYMEFELRDGSIVSLWYQRWPAGSLSVQSTILARHGVSSAGTRPDLVVTRTGRDGAVLDAVLLELKASEEASTVADGVTQVLGYLGDRDRLLTTKPSGWVVPLGGFAGAEATREHPAWLVDCDSVADALVERFSSSGPGSVRV